MKLPIDNVTIHTDYYVQNKYSRHEKRSLNKVFDIVQLFSMLTVKHLLFFEHIFACKDISYIVQSLMPEFLLGSVRARIKIYQS